MTYIFGVAAMLAGLQTQPEALTLDKALDIAFVNSFSVKTAQSNVVKTNEKVKEVRGGLLPKVTLGGSITAYSPAINQGSRAPDLKDSRQLTAAVSMPVDLAGNITKAVNAAQASRKSSEENVNTSKNDLRRDVRKAFYRVLQSQESVKISDQALASARERLKNTDAQFKAGSAAKVDVLRAQVQVSSAEIDLSTSLNNLEVAKEALNNSLGRAINTSFDAQPVQELPAFGVDPDLASQSALLERPELKSLRETAKVLSLTTAIQRSGLQPSLALSVTHQQNLQPTSGSRENQNVGVAALTFPIWDSGVTRAKVAQAKEDEKQLKINIDQVSLAISLEVRTAISNLKNAEKRLKLALENEKVAAEAFRLSNIRRDAGEGILLEVLDAQSDLTKARVNTVSARYDYLSAFADLQRAIGLDELKQIKMEQTNR